MRNLIAGLMLVGIGSPAPAVDGVVVTTSPPS